MIYSQGEVGVLPWDTYVHDRRPLRRDALPVTKNKCFVYVLKEMCSSVQL